MTAKGKDASGHLTPSELGELYPTPKTYDDLEKEAAERQELFRERRTKIPAFKIALYGTILFVTAAYYASTIELLLMFGGVIITVLGYIVWAILLLFAIKWIRYTRSIFYEYDSTAMLFWIFYVLLMALPLAALTYGWVKNPWPEYTILALSAYNFVIIYLFAKIFLHTRR